MFFSVECEDEDDEHNHKRSHEDDEQRSGAESVIVKDWIEPWPLERAAAAGEQRKGKITIILEALHQFQRNPNIQIFITMMSKAKWRQEDIPLNIASMGGCLIWLLLIRK
jgi:hypothetical protein